MSAQALSDDEIIASVLSGDTEAFGLLYDRYNRYVAAIIVKHVPAQEVEDVMLECFTRAFNSLSSLEKFGSFRSWIATISVRASYDYWRIKKSKPEYAESSLSAEHKNLLEHAQGKDAVEIFQHSQNQRMAQEIVQWALSKLGAEDRMVLSLMHLEEKTARQTAEILGWKLSTVTVRSTRARRKMKKILATLESGRK
jgi:RNA polymerase sigma-70 factor (ECF subfamily)